MRCPASIRSLLALAFVAYAGSGCDALKTPLDSSSGAVKCVAAMGPNGPCNRCYDRAGTLVLDECPPPPPMTMTCSEATDVTGRVCKTCVDATGKVVSQDCIADVPGTMCVKVEDGGPTSCKDPATWKKYGTDACNQRNMVLTDVVGGAMCSAGYQNVTYVCCGTGAGGSTGTGGSPGTGGSSGGGMCTKIEEGGPGSCKPYDIWKQYGSDRCQQQNLALTDIALGPTCDGGYQSVVFVCCGGMGTPSPPPPKCAETTDANGQICKTCWDSVTGAVISSACIPGSTGSGGSGGGGGEMCIAIDDGGPSSCKDAATWEKYGTERCSQQNRVLSHVKWAVACDGGYSMVTYVCCGAGAPLVP